MLFRSEGRLKTRKWTDKEGVEKYTTEIVASEMQLLGSREGTGGDEAGGGQRSAPASRPAAGRPAATAAKSSSGFADMDDDIPF